MFAITGSHRSGKSTLAWHVAGRMGLHFLETSVGATLRERGYDPVVPMTPAERLGMQEELLKIHLEMIDRAPRPTVTDRCPLDMAAYTLAEIGMHADPALDERIQDYVRHCVHATRIHYDVLIALAPLPAYAVEEGKPPPNRAYQSHIQLLIEGMMVRCTSTCATYWISDTGLETRVERATELLSDRMAEVADFRKDATFH